MRVVDDATLSATEDVMMPNTADMVRLHRVTGMRPCELCAMTWADIDTSRTPWVYRVPDAANKNAWRGEYGMPRVVLIGPKGRAILERHRGDGRGAPFSPLAAVGEAVALEGRCQQVDRAEKAPHVPRRLGDHWDANAYGHTIRAACRRAGVEPWGANRLRYTFGTEVRRAYGLAAAKAVLGHTEGGCVTDTYTYDALEDELIMTATTAVEALG